MAKASAFIASILPARSVHGARGDSLRTQSNQPDVAVALVLVAEERGWGSIKVRGTDSFRREVFIEASGLPVAGFKPKESDVREIKERARRYVKENSVESQRELKTTEPLAATVPAAAYVAARDLGHASSCT